ncbi:NADH-quinone oxidoreductase subunit J [Acidocella aminolytica]|jgi:NADH-quinone oxidoreductase subunit J|uniref:NADH-quinone oxidoreductase subunit J n=1 Tax=Acidocella aminolytica 101 = DSM 11237 TaxID=1120923 RepID=A0A0D6PDI6_9PROT|nr:NADH-quinone oxidoreductase subunit J [Acidocella aminolytica]GAN79717.1 NADH-quinone oxidoreductase subunit J [Acidocella aminolytica 101 = DSM 11237]GBQ39835.1 NADH-quinone oxidoreductase chain J [Acidocella aminolytica 101 = DSM 11237]SHE73049.1 NADH dehydrogenase subunit J [Acidocella aminolytica 101 = DSM 11237]
MIANLAFYLFSFILLASAVMVVTSRNPVHAVLFLILGFVNAAVLFLLTGAEFLAFILAIVYVGAVAVIFLFVVMMLDVDFVKLNEGFQRYAPVGALVALIMFIELVFIAGNWAIAPAGSADRMFPTPEHLTSSVALGSLIYTSYLPLFQLSGMVLLVAMIGAIVLTHRDRQRSLHQNLAAQHARTPEQTLAMVPAKLGEGASLPPKQTQKETL